MKIALLGAGLMGQPMAERLLASGHEVVVYNRTREKAEQLKPKGAAIADESDEAIRSVVSMILGRELGECGLFSIVQRGESRRRGRALKILGKVLSV